MQDWNRYWKILTDGTEIEKPRNEEAEQHKGTRNGQECSKGNGTEDILKSAPSIKKHIK